MGTSLRSPVVCILAGLFLSLLMPSMVYAQCNGADGTGIYFGSVANADNGTICANNPVLPARMDIDIRNVTEGAGQVKFVIDWQDGTTQTVNAAKTAANRFFASVPHTFPPTGANVRCEYMPTVRIQYGNNAPCVASLGIPPRFVRWNTDNENTGELLLSETVRNVQTYRVCAGVETAVTFTDRSTLNCVPPDLTLGQNDRMRWRQFVYGTVNTITGAVKIAGATPAFPFNGAVSQSVEPTVNSGFPVATTQVITIPATAQVGERFRIRMNYWNTCNSYTGGRPPVDTWGEILVVAQPTAPNTSAQTVCNGTTPSNFTISVPGGLPGGAIVNWYRNAAGDVPGTLLSSGTSQNLNITSVPGYTNNTTAGDYKVWVAYRENIANALNCESPRVMLTRTIKNAIPVPAPTVAPPANLCNTAQFSITFPNPGTETFGGATQYSYGTATGVTIASSTANSVTYNTNITFAPGEQYVDRTVTVTRRFTTGSTCDRTRDFTIRIYNAPVGGTLSNFPDRCQGASIGPITLSGHTGNILGWEVSVNGGAWGAYGGPTCANCITPGVLAAGTYQYRALIGNSPCAPNVYSSIEQVVVSASIGAFSAGPDQDLCGVTSTTLAGTLPGATTGAWTYVSSVPVGRPAPTFSNATSGTSNVSIANPTLAGAYTLRWTVSSGTCSVTDDVVIDFGSVPDPVPVRSIRVCGEDATLTMPAPSIGTGVWTIQTAPGTITIDDLNSPTSDVSLGAPFTYGTYVLRWTVTSGICAPAQNDHTIIFDRPVTVSASDITTPQCLSSTGGTVINLTGTIGGGATSGTWAVVAGGGTVSASTLVGTTVTATYTSSVSDYSTLPTIQVKLIAAAGGTSVCANAEQTIDIAVDRRPVAVATSPLATCGDAVQLDAESPIPYGATGMWTGPVGVTFDDPTDPETFVRNLPLGPPTGLTWTLTSAGGTCTHAVAVSVNRVNLPASTNVDLLLCETPPAGAPLTTSIILADHESAVTSIPAANRTIQWYKDGPPPTGTPIAVPTVTLTNVADGAIFVARIQETATGCTSDAFVTVNVRPLPTANSGNVAICEDAIGSGSAAGVDLIGDITFHDAVTSPSNTVTWFPDMANAVANTSPITAAFNLTGSRTVVARVEYSSGNACPNYATINLSVKPLPDINAIIGRSQVCLGDPATDPDELPVETYQVKAITGAKYHWTVPTGPTKFKQFGGGGINDFFVLLQFPNLTTPSTENIDVWVELNGCSSGTVSLPITVNDQPIKPIIAGPEVVCENADGVMYNVVSPNATSNYTWQIKKVSDDTDGGAFVQVGQGLDQIFAQFTDERVYFIVKEVAPSLCVSDTAQYWVDVNRRPKLFDADGSVCSDAPIGVVFAPDATSPVAIDRYDINIIAPSATLAWVNPASSPAYPWANAPANAIQNHAFENLSAVPGTVRYNVTPISLADGISCPGAPVDITMTINPEPQLDPNLDREICSGEETGIVLISRANTFPANRFIIDAIVVSDPGVTPATPINIPAIADGTTMHLDNIITTHAWINNTGVNQTVTYRVRPASTLINCVGNPPTPVVVTIYPQTDVDPVTDPVLCNGDPLNVSFTSTNNSDADFAWVVTGYSADITIGSQMFGNGPITGMVIMNTSTTVDGTVTFEVRGVNSASEGGNACDNPPRTFTVTVRNSPVANALVKHGCSDAPNGTSLFVNLSTLETEINPDAGTAGIGITWYKNYDVLLGLSNPMTPAEILNYQMVDNVAVFVEVENLNTNCKKIVPIKYRVTPGVFITATPDVHGGYNLFCNNDNSGAIPIHVDSGTPSYSFRMNGGPFINAGVTPNYSFTSLAAGNYSLEVVDGEGCRATDNIVLTQPDPLDAQLTELNPISCFLYQDGGLSTTVTGGTTPYASYLLLQTNTSNATGTFSNLGAGTYNVRVTDANGCKADSDPLPFTHPAAVEIDNISVLTDANGFNLSCRDAVDGEIALEVNGGNVPNNYTITMTKASDPTNPIIGNTTLHNHTFTGLGSGNYSIVAEDAKGCPSLPSVAIIINPPPFSPGFIGINQAVCAGDDAAPINQLVPAFGGVGNYQYQWQLSLTGSMNDAEWVNIPLATATTYDPAVLAQTTYFRRLASSVSARTGVACEILGKDNIVQVTINPLPVVSFNAPTEVCQGDSFSLLLGMTGGAAPIEYDYSAGATTFLNMIGTENTMIPVSNFQAPQDYTLLRVKDLNGCLAANVPQLVHVEVIKTNSDFTVLAPAEQCSGGTFSFQWEVEAGIKYTWIWSDGSQDVIVDGERPVGVNTITHVFTSGNTQTSTPYPVRLQAENALCSPKFTTKNITVLPSVRLNILPGDTILCSGESIRFIDQSEGVDNGRWYYRPVGSGEERDVRSGPLSEISYQMFNTTTTNPIFYEVVYEASNTEGCSDVFKQELKVYRGITAGILNTPDPPDPFVGGISTIEFTNNSAPLDAAAFEYTWDFDDARATPPTGSGINPITVDYFKAGIKNVKLTAVNILSRDENNTCSSTIVKQINIMLPTVGAAFKATPLASCFPVNITVENLSPGADTFVWELYDQSGLVGTSNLREPEFRILTPGVYDIYLTASYYSTGQTATAVQKGIEVFDVPTALFEMRPNPLYVPDTELQTFNKSARATEYHWDFDDGTLSNEFEPRHFYKLEGKYNVVLVAGKDYGMKDIDGDGILDKNIVCYDTTRNELVALDGGFVKLPNAFTPSANGSTGGVAGNGTFNDVFLPIARGVEEFEMQIFDRWGNLLFETEDRNVGWDGYDKNRRPMPAGVYVYKLIMRLSNGQRTTKIGDVTLIR